MVGRVLPRFGEALHLAFTNAFLHGLIVGSYVAGAVVAVGVLTIVLFLPVNWT